MNNLAENNKKEQDYEPTIKPLQSTSLKELRGSEEDYYYVQDAHEGKPGSPTDCLNPLPI